MIALVDRGRCSFATKARNGESSGASLVIIADDRYENIHDVTLNDDGMGPEIGIPTVLIDRYSGSILKKYTESNTTVTLDLEGINQRAKMELELWYSSNSEDALTFISSFKSQAESLADYVNFTPRLLSWSCPSCSRTYRSKECLDNGLYCAPSNVKNKSRSIDGKDILMENLR